jgi:hypothetical protein
VREPKDNCQLCHKENNLFKVIKEGEGWVKACSRCITAEHLTGWSK